MTRRQRVQRQREAIGIVVVVLVASLLAILVARKGEFEVGRIFSTGGTVYERPSADAQAQVSTGEPTTTLPRVSGPSTTTTTGIFKSVAGPNTTFKARDKGRAPEPRFIIKHLSKAGGTFSTWLARKVVNQNYLTAIEDDRVLPKYLYPTDFLAITMRNPCDWYVSWAHGAPKKIWGYKNPMFGPNPVNPPVGYRIGPISEEEFHDFVLNSRAPDGLGFLSWYFWHLIVEPDCNHFTLRQLKKENFKKNETPGKCLNYTRIREDWKTLDPMRFAHCYIYQETAMSDWRYCLEAWQKVAPWARNAVDWKLFEAYEANATLTEQGFNQKFGKFEGKSLSSQQKRHKPCSELVQGNLSKEIKRADPGLFEKFGYLDCCQSSRHTHW